MAINPEVEFAGAIDPADDEYPHGKARDVVTSGDGTGTPWVKNLANDLFGFNQAVLQRSGQTPSGLPETALGSQYLQGILALSSEKIPSVQDVSNIAKPLLVDGASFVLLEWHPGLRVGGSLFQHDASRPVADHDGGVVISLTVPWTGSTPDYLNGVGETAPGGFGCLVRCDQNKVSFVDYGAKPNDPAHNDTQCIINAFATGLPVVEESAAKFVFDGASGVNVTNDFMAYGTTIQYTGNTEGIKPISDDVYLRGFTLEDTGSNVTDGILPPLTPINNLKVQDVTIKGMQRFGLRCNFAFTKLTIDNVVIEDHGRAAVSDSTGLSVNAPSASTGLSISNTRTTLRDPSGGRSLILKNVSGRMSDSSFKRGTGGLIVESAIIGDTAAGVSDFKLSDCTISDETPDDYTLKIRLTNVKVSNLTVEGANDGVEFDDCDGLEFSDSSTGVWRSVGASLVLTDVKVSGNRRINGIDWGEFNVADKIASFTDVHFTNNKFSENVVFRAAASGVNNSFTHNTIHQGTECAFESINCRVHHNDFVMAVDPGAATAVVYLNGPVGHVIDFTQNTVTGNGYSQWGIFLGQLGGVTGHVDMNSIYGTISAEIAENPGGTSMTKFHNNEGGVIV